MALTTTDPSGFELDPGRVSKPKASRARSESRADAGPASPKPIILLVDDHPTNLMLAKTLFESEGFDVRTARDAVSVFEALKVCTPAVIVMDIQLPGMDGWELTQRLRTNAVTRHIPVIAVTAYGHPSDIARAQAVGFAEYVPKPLNTRELPRIVRRHLPRE